MSAKTARNRASKVDQLLELDSGDSVELELDGDTYSGVVTTWHHDSAEKYADSVPVKGRLSIGVELDNQSVSEHDCPSHNVSILVTESRPERWDDPDVQIWEPVTDEDNYIVEEQYTDLGTLNDVSTPSE